MTQQFATDNAAKDVNTVTERLVHSKDAVIIDTKDAVKDGLEIAAGMAALATIRSFVLPAKISLIDKVTGKGRAIQKLVNSPIGSFVIAATAHAGIQAFAPKNAKLRRIGQLALKASVVELMAAVPVQEYTDKLAAKLFDNKAINSLFENDSDKKTDA